MNGSATSGAQVVVPSSTTNSNPPSNEDKENHNQPLEEEDTTTSATNSNSSSKTPEPTTTSVSSLIQASGPHVPHDKIPYLVQTPYGRGVILRTRRDSPFQPQQHEETKTTKPIVMREVELIDWSASTTNTTATTTTTTNTLSKPTDDKNARRPLSPPATLYSCQDYPSVPPQVGDEVMTLFGMGVVQEIRNDNNTPDNSQDPQPQRHCYVVQLSSWRLARRQPVTCYISSSLSACSSSSPSTLRVVRRRKFYELTTVSEKLDWAQTRKQAATRAFQQGHLITAWNGYQQAREAVRYVQHQTDNDNWLRAELLVLLITSCNNAATCACQILLRRQRQQRASSSPTKKPTTLQNKDKITNEDEEPDASVLMKDAVESSRAAIALLQALQRQQGTTGRRIRSILRHDHHLGNAKLFGQWHIKAQLLQCQVSLLQHNLSQAYTAWKQAHDLVQHYLKHTVSTTNNNRKPQTKNTSSIKTGQDNDTAATPQTNDDDDGMMDASTRQQLLLQEKEIKVLSMQYKQQLERQVQNEKRQAQAMFGGTTKGTVAKKKNSTPKSTDTSAIPTTQSSSTNDKNQNSTKTMRPSLVSSPSSSPRPNGRRSVSFRETVEHFEIPSRGDEQYHHHNDKNEDENWVWYSDVEFLMGLSVFGGAAVLAAVGTAFLVFGTKPVMGLASTKSGSRTT